MPRRADPRRPKSAGPKSVADVAAPSEAAAAPNADEACFFAMARAWDGELAPAPRERGEAAAADEAEGAAWDGELARAPEAPPQQLRAVALNRVTLQFSDEGLQAEFVRLTRPRREALWLRSLLVAALFQVFFMMLDLHVFGRARLAPRLHWLAPARLLLAVCQLSLFALARLRLVRPSQSLMLLNGVGYGAATQALYIAQRADAIGPWDALFLV